MGENKQAKQVSLSSLYLACVYVQPEVNMVVKKKKKSVPHQNAAGIVSASYMVFLG